MTQDNLIQTFLSLPDEAAAAWLQNHQDRLDQDFVAALRTEAEAMGYDQADLAGALAILDRAATAAGVIADPAAMGLVWRGRASVLQRHDRFEESLAATHAAVAIYEEHGTPFDVAVARTIEVYLLGILERFDEAIALAQWIRPHFEAETFTLGLAYLDTNLAQVYVRLWRLDEALQTFTRAQQQYLALDMPQQAAEMLHDMGVVANQMDDLETARAYYDRAYPQFVTSDNRYLLVKTKYNLAQICLRQGRYEAALDHLAQAREDLSRLSREDNTPDAAYIDFFEARVRRALNQAAEAQALFTQARRTFERSGHQIEVAWALLELGQLIATEVGPDRLAQGLAYLDQAEAHLQRAEIPILTAWVNLEQGRLLLALGQKQAAADRAGRARAIFGGAGLSLRGAQAEILLADCVRRLDPAQAEPLYRSALMVIGDSIPALAAHCWRGLGQLALEAGDPAAAERAYIEATTLLEMARRSLRGHHHQAGFFEDKQVLAEELLAAIQAQPDPAYPVLTWVERFKAQALTDLLANQPPDEQASPELTGLLAERDELYRQLDQHLARVLIGGSGQIAETRQRGPALFAHDAHQTRKLAQLRRALGRLEEQIAQQRDLTYAWREGVTIEPQHVHQVLDTETICLSYYTIAGQLHALTATSEKGDLQLHPLPVSLSEIEHRWGQTRPQLLRPRGAIMRMQTRLAYLWQQLIAPCLDRLQTKRRLLIIPYRSLFHIPFGALYDPHKKRYLVEDWALQLVPNLTILDRCRRQGRANKPPLLVGYPGQADQPGYLPGVESEIRAVAGLFPRADILLNETATLANVIAAMPGHSFVHLAGHTTYNTADPLQSGTYLAAGRRLRATDLYLRYGHLAGATVVLSSCEAGAGQPTGGDVLGLTSAYLYAGAVGIVAGLWPVDDAATAELMIALYQALHAGLDTAEALQRAQRRLIQSDHYAAPYFWAAFALSGDSRSG